MIRIPMILYRYRINSLAALEHDLIERGICHAINFLCASKIGSYVQGIIFQFMKICSAHLTFVVPVDEATIWVMSIKY